MLIIREYSLGRTPYHGQIDRLSIPAGAKVIDVLNNGEFVAISMIMESEEIGQREIRKFVSLISSVDIMPVMDDAANNENIRYVGSARSLGSSTVVYVFEAIPIPVIGKPAAKRQPVRSTSDF